MQQHTYTNILQQFSPISLGEIERIGLRRMETKFMVPVHLVPHLLQSLVGSYHILETAGTRMQAYTTHYFDSPDMRLYLDHHNGYARRIKVRQRRYEQTGDCYFEIKQKRHDSSNDKFRLKVGSLTHVITPAQRAAVQYPHIEGEQLQLTLINTFNRVSLCNTDTAERVTVDTDLMVGNNLSKLSLTNIAVVEIKQAKYNGTSAAMQYAKANQLREQSFSKYAIGAALLYPTLKRNNFKNIIQKIAHATQ